MAELVDAFVEIDQLLLQSIDVKIQPILILEDIEAGSLKSWFRTELESTDDGAIKNFKWKPLVGTYLVKAKYIVIDFLNEKTEISNLDQIEALSAKLSETAKETDVLRIPAYTSNGADYPFDKWILPRGARCGKDLLDPGK